MNPSIAALSSLMMRGRGRTNGRPVSTALDFSLIEAVRCDATYTDDLRARVLVGTETGYKLNAEIECVQFDAVFVMCK